VGAAAVAQRVGVGTAATTVIQRAGEGGNGNAVGGLGQGGAGYVERVWR